MPGTGDVVAVGLTVFVDLDADRHAEEVAFWGGVTGFSVSASRGLDGEFVTLRPEQADGYLRVQRLREGPSRLHLDVHVLDLDSAVTEALGLGATRVTSAGPGHVVLTSPGGLACCLVTGPGGGRRPGVRAWPGGHRSSVYQVCLDAPRSAYDAEAAFWAGLLGATTEPLESRPEFAWLRPHRPLALDVLLQRLDEAEGAVRAHLDVGTDNRRAEVARHVALGATGLVQEEFWTVLRDPAGLPYCVTDRDPATGTLVTPGLA